jgi:hypothetical protein
MFVTQDVGRQAVYREEHLFEGEVEELFFIGIPL